jgi:hypothetical protein
MFKEDEVATLYRILALSVMLFPHPRFLLEAILGAFGGKSSLAGFFFSYAVLHEID